MAMVYLEGFSGYDAGVFARHIMQLRTKERETADQHFLDGTVRTVVISERFAHHNIVYDSQNTDQMVRTVIDMSRTESDIWRDSDRPEFAPTYKFEMAGIDPVERPWADALGELLDKMGDAVVAGVGYEFNAVGTDALRRLIIDMAMKLDHARQFMPEDEKPDPRTPGRKVDLT